MGSSRRSNATTACRPQFELAFLSSGPPRLGLTDEDYLRAAAALETEVDTIKSLARVDLDSPAFDALGRPAMRFEIRSFHRHTAGRFEQTRSRISQVEESGSLSRPYELLQAAYDLAPVAALKSAMWGRFHVSGSKHRAAGCTTVNQLVLAIAQSEAAHLTTFVSVVQSDGALRTAVRAKNWGSFASHYKE